MEPRDFVDLWVTESLRSIVRSLNRLELIRVSLFLDWIRTELDKIKKISKFDIKIE